MPESRAEAEARAEKEGFPKSNVYCLENGDSRCYIAPKGITTTAAKRAYAEARDSGDDKETAARKAWAVQKNVEESRNMNEQRNLSYTRQAKLASEVRSETEQGKKLVIRGYAILFNNPTQIWDERNGHYEEIVLPSALKNTDLSDVYLLGGHNPDNLLGRTGKNLRLEVDETGLFFECELPNTQLARDYYNLTESGILDGTSFQFGTPNEVRNGKRSVTEITRLPEITLTPFPAYAEASVVAARSTTESKQETNKLTFAEALKQIKEIK